LYVDSITQHNVTMPAASAETKFLNRIKLSLLTIGRPQWAMEFGQFCRGKPRNFANWPAEFGKIFRRNCRP